MVEVMAIRMLDIVGLSPASPRVVVRSGTGRDFNSFSLASILTGEMTTRMLSVADFIDYLQGDNHQHQVHQHMGSLYVDLGKVPDKAYTLPSDVLRASVADIVRVDGKAVQYGVVARTDGGYLRLVERPYQWLGEAMRHKGGPPEGSVILCVSPGVVLDNLQVVAEYTGGWSASGCECAWSSIPLAGV